MLFHECKLNTLWSRSPHTSGQIEQISSVYKGCFTKVHFHTKKLFILDGRDSSQETHSISLATRILSPQVEARFDFYLSEFTDDFSNGNGSVSIRVWRLKSWLALSGRYRSTWSARSRAEDANGLHSQQQSNRLTQKSIQSVEKIGIFAPDSSELCSRYAVTYFDRYRQVIKNILKSFEAHLLLLYSKRYWTKKGKISRRWLFLSALFKKWISSTRIYSFWITI